MKTPQINQTIKKISLLIIFIATAVIASTAVARADGVLTPQEEQFGDSISGALCDFVSNAGVTNASMAKAIDIIYRHTPINMDMTDAVDIINYTVYNYCPQHWDDLVAFGEGFRGGSYA